MLKKIAILSFRNPFNYGAELQVFALGKKLQMLGYNTEVLNVARPFIDADARRSNKLKVSYNDTFKARLRAGITFVKQRTLWLLHYERSTLKIKNSDAFHNRYNCFTKHRFRNFDELYTAKFDYTHYIVGSDQVWNFEYPFSLEPYFLSFVKAGKKIAYAASIGHSKLPDSLKKYYKQHLQEFDHISMREMQGSTIVSALLGKPIETMLDPTLLITPQEWRQTLEIENKSNNSVVIYLRSYRPYAIRLAKEMGLRHGIKKIVYIGSRVTKDFDDPEVDYRYDVSTPEFVSLFANASFVITNSFHGTAFAVNFGRRFFTVVNDSMKTASRFYSLLEQTNLLDRICKEETPFECIIDNPVPEEDACIRLETLREKSINFLHRTLC